MDLNTLSDKDKKDKLLLISISVDKIGIFKLVFNGLIDSNF